MLCIAADRLAAARIAATARRIAATASRTFAATASHLIAAIARLIAATASRIAATASLIVAICVRRGATTSSVRACYSRRLDGLGRVKDYIGHARVVEQMEEADK